MVTIVDLDALARRGVDDEANTYHRKGLEEWSRAERYFREIERENRLILLNRIREATRTVADFSKIEG